MTAARVTAEAVVPSAASMPSRKAVSALLRVWDWSLDLPAFVGGALFLVACWLVVTLAVAGLVAVYLAVGELVSL